MKPANPQISSPLRQWVTDSLQTPHGRIVLAGVAVLLGYFPFWLLDLLLRTLRGSSGMLLATAAALGFWQLWTQRHQLRQRVAPEEDRLLGHGLIVSGMILFPFCLSAFWSQVVICLIILVGIACSCWGVGFFSRYPLPVFLIGLGFFPKPTLVAQMVFQALAPPRILERFMAWSGGLGLQLIGYSVTVEGRDISLPDGSVTVAWGCNGFDMATTMAVASLVLGLFLKQSRTTILLMMSVGITLALLFNIPRIMLVTIASVYWGEHWFEFWHSSWGGQIFVGVLFTIYYYVVMALVKQPTGQKP